MLKLQFWLKLLFYLVEFESTDEKDSDNSYVTQEIPDSVFEIENIEARIRPNDPRNIATLNCFDIEYMNSEDIQLNVVLKPNEDKNNGQTIFTTKPKINEQVENIILCLEDIIGFQAKRFNISFNVKHHRNRTNFVFDCQSKQSAT